MTVKENTLSLTDHNMVFGTNRKTSMLYSLLSTLQQNIEHRKLSIKTPDHLQQNIEHRKLSIETLSQAKRLCRSLVAGYILYGMISKKKKQAKKVWTLWPLWPPEFNCPLSTAFTAIQDPWGRLKWIGNVYTRPYLDFQGMARLWPVWPEVWPAGSLTTE